ncbi:UNVERIFIED_CONTAM: hypothetical protein Sangu_0559800 [Sesamum angustifolium]|uniref:Uncharacterized protein n=1 Tax=Sesamum angustifolium TaxID=2727405 RepID=A0AAW2Q9Y3_9LAMI
MVSFNLSLSKFEGPPASAVILKFELLYTPVLENRFNVQACLDTSPAAVHEFRLPPKALLGLHAYCPVHFDAFHAVLVDTSIHVSLLKSGVHSSSLKISSDPRTDDDDIDGEHDKSKQVMLVKALSSARDILLEELQKLSKAINQPIDINDITSNELFGSTPRSDRERADAKVPGQVSSNPLNVLEKPNDEVDFRDDGLLYSLSVDKLLRSFDLIGNQMSYLWSVFLNFHRANIKKIVEFLCNQWALDRRAEWSIWMVYTKVEMPHQYISNVVDDSSIHGLRGRATITSEANWRYLRRYSFAADQQPVPSRLAYIWRPSRVPIVLVERVVNAPVRPTSGNSYFSHVDQKYTNSLTTGVGSDSSNKLSGASPRQSGRVLKIVFFVHGFRHVLLCI